MKCYLLFACIFAVLFSSCANRNSSNNPNFVQNALLLKKGMRVDQVLKIMGEPFQSSSIDNPGVVKGKGDTYIFLDSKYSPRANLTTTFLNGELTNAMLTIIDPKGKYNKTKMLIETGPQEYRRKGLLRENF
jgi:hypothetical protein